ncbi:T9SS type B sorting domain-containing protein [Lacinutrix sp. WUR7]|nr:T9SS type B sorting domain-containing protein [Lacinutrix sp. WUR7]
MGSSGSDCPSLSVDFNIPTGINDNDEFELLKNSVIIDNVHAPNERGYSIIRNADATIPQTTYDSNDWSISSQEDCSDLGVHTADAIPDNTPNITHPTSQSICENGSTTFTASEDSGTFSYQWKTLNASGNWVNVTNNTNYSGATTGTLTLNNVPVSFDNNQYYCEITSPSCTLITNAAQLEINVINPPTLECWQTATFNSTTCDWIITGTQDPIPTGLACWETATFNTTTCAWEVTGTQDPIPTGLACWETTTFNNTTCAWEVTGTQAPMPTGLACWETTTFNNTTCAWEVTGTQDPMPTGLACWETTTFNNTTCSWVITGIPIDFDLSLSNITIVDNTITVNMTDISINYIYIVDSGASQENPTFTDLANGLHTLEVQDENGCVSKSISFEVLVNLDAIVIPNGFSPNGDGINEWFNIQGLYDTYTNHSLEIYNRYGSLIFKGNNDNKWYGKANKGLLSTDKTLPVGTYFYVLHLNDANASKQRYIGWVYLNK